MPSNTSTEDMEQQSRNCKNVMPEEASANEKPEGEANPPAESLDETIHSKLLSADNMNDDSLASSGVTIQVEENFVTAPIELCAETSIWQNTLDIVIKTLEQVRDFVEIDSYVQDAMTVFSRHTDVDDEPLREARLSAEKAILEVIPVLKYIAAGIHRRSDESIN